jgi:hypothetical protein
MTVLAVLLAGLAVGVSGAVAGGPSAPVIDGCDPWGGDTPDCYLDDSFFEADQDTTYGYGGGACFDVRATRGGTWWAAHYDRHHVCVANGEVYDLGSPNIYPTASLPWPMSWTYGPDLNWSGPYESGLPTDYATTGLNFNFRWCSWKLCGSRVYGFINIDVTGWGGVYCYSDRGWIPNCRGRV